MSIAQILILFFCLMSLLCVLDGSKLFKKGNTSKTPKVNNKSVIDSSDTGCFGQSKSLKFTKSKIPNNVKTHEAALAIYKANGIPKANSSNKTVYKVIGSKTSITFGHAVCKHVLTQMEKPSGLKSVEIINNALIPFSYKHANEEYNNKFKKLYGAKCNYQDVNGVNDFLFVTDTKIKDYYCIFSPDKAEIYRDGNNNLYVKIEACFKIEINEESDFPIITGLKETPDSYIAETIFRNYGPLPVIDSGHVCSIMPPTYRSFSVCTSFQQKHKHLYNVKVNPSAKCDVKEITWRPIKGTENRPKEVNPKIWAAVCDLILLKGSLPLTEQILLFNANILTNHYYVAKFYGPEWHIISIVKLDQ